jgi:hypothetical protein
VFEPLLIVTIMPCVGKLLVCCGGSQICSGGGGVDWFLVCFDDLCFLALGR